MRKPAYMGFGQSLALNQCDPAFSFTTDLSYYILGGVWGAQIPYTFLEMEDRGGCKFLVSILGGGAIIY